MGVCAEAIDNGGRALNLVLPDAADLTAGFEPGLLGGVMVVHSKGWEISHSPGKPSTSSPVNLRLIPYYAWANRGPGELQVWLPTSKDRL